MLGGNRCGDFSLGNRDDDDPPPPPSAEEIMMEAEQNRRDQTRLLERIEQNTSCQRHSVVTIQDFILLNPPVFRCSSEPLGADDWLRSLSVSLRRPMLLQVILCYSWHNFWKVLLFSGGKIL